MTTKRLIRTGLAACPLVALLSAPPVFGVFGDPDNANVEPYASHAHEPLLVGPLADGADAIPADAAGIGSDHLRRLPADGELSEIEMQIVSDTITAINWERSRRDIDAGPDYSPGSYPLAVSENMARVQHRWAEWLSGWYDERSGSDLQQQCPVAYAETDVRTCHSVFPLWDASVFYHYGVTFQPDAGGAVSGPTWALPGGWVKGWTESHLHRGDVLSNNVRFAAVAIDCRPDGRTFVEWIGGEHDPTVSTRSPNTAPNAAGASVLPDGLAGDSATISPSFGHRCPQPAHPLAPIVDGSHLSVRAEPGPNLSLKSSYLYDPDGPTLDAPPTTWQVAVDVRTSDGETVATVNGAAYGPTFGSPTTLPIGQLANGDYTLTWRWFNEHEQSQHDEREFTIYGGVLIEPPTGQTPAIRFIPVDPYRAIDTRLTGSRLTAGEVRAIRLDGAPTGATAVTLNATAVAPSEAGYLSLFPCASVRPVVSNVNYSRGDAAVPNQVTVSIDNAGELCVFSLADVDVVLDVSGWWAPAGALGFASSSARLHDSRVTGRFTAGEIREIGVPPGVAAVSLNMTGIDPDATSYATVFPCGGQRPVVSNLNVRPGEVRPNHATVKVGTAGRICVFTLNAMDVIVDLTGVWSDLAGTLQSTAPRRAFDSRASTRFSGGEVRQVIDQQPGVVFANLTATAAARAGYLAAFACADGWSGTSTVNFAPGQPAIANAVVVDAERGGVCVRASADVDVIVDTFAAQIAHGPPTQ